MKKTTKLFLMYALALMLVFAPNAAYALSLTSVVANDDSEDGDGVDSTDTLTITFDEDVQNKADVTASNVDSFFTLSGSKTWPSVSTVAWSAVGGGSGSGVLTITFGTTSGTIDKGDTLTPETDDADYTFIDDDDEDITSTDKTILGSFDRQWDNYDDTSYIDSANDIFVDGDYAYVANGADGVLTLDVSDQAGMTIGDTVTLSDDADAIYVEGDYAYVCAEGKLYVVDVADPEDIDDTNNDTTEGDCLELVADSEYVYIADGDKGLSIFEINDDDVTEVGDGGFDGGWDGDVVDIFVEGNYAYLAVDDADNGLVVVDISSPSALTADDVVDMIETDADATGVFVDGDYAYVTIGSEGLQVFDISDPTNIKDKDTDENVIDSSGGNANAVYFSDRYAFVADKDNGIKVVKVTSGSIATSVSEDIDFDLGTDQCVSVFVDDGWAYLACEESGVFSVNVDDISSGGSGDGPDYTDGDLYVYAAYEGDDSDGSREKPYAAIQDAIDAASKNDEIMVFPGVYEEEITIDVEGLTLTGVGPSFVTIRGDGDATVTIDEDDVTFKGFTVSEGDEGIYVKGGDEIVIKNNVIIDTVDYGIHVDDIDTDIINNTIVQNDGSGVYVEGDPVLEIRNNIFAENGEYGLEGDDGTADDNATLGYNLYYGNDTSARSNFTSATGDVTTDPEFEDEDDDDFDWGEDGWLEDFYLDSGSNAEDVGDSSSTYNDNDGSRNDMGAFGGPDGQYDDADEPEEPEEPDASASALKVTLTWDENAESDLFGYYIERSTAATSGYSQLNDEPVIGAEYEDTVTSAGTYYYRVVAVDLFEEESDPSDEAFVTTVGTTPVATQFSDVPTTSEFYTYIMDLKGDGIINGFGDGTFKPLRNVTRAEFLKMSLNAANINSSAYAAQASCFSDMVTTHPLKQYVCYAYANGYVSGSGGKFYPEREITRFEAMKILLNVNLIPDITATTSSFSDVVLAEQIRYIEKGYALGLVSGYGNGIFGPNNNILRQESAKIVSNMRAYRGLGGIYTQNCSKTCAQITTCIEAYYQQNVCGGLNLDSDADGIPCEDICAG
ncbi:MAG: S-layer homology domain-containing protein [Candidatus Gracilibacteria bacterium]|nr:S-layer homology domain-containing protein [Candidatus Gracilibacteria bacterium]